MAQNFDRLTTEAPQILKGEIDVCVPLLPLGRMQALENPINQRSVRPRGTRHRDYRSAQTVAE
jgi:hypothetical protein